MSSSSSCTSTENELDPDDDNDDMDDHEVEEFLESKEKNKSKIKKRKITKEYLPSSATEDEEEKIQNKKSNKVKKSGLNHFLISKCHDR